MSDEKTEAGSVITLLSGEQIDVRNPPQGVASLMRRHAGEGVIAFESRSDDGPPTFVALDKIVSWREAGDVFTEVL